MVGRDTRQRTIEATARSFAIIEALRDLDGARVTELSDELDISKGTVYHHLSTLRELGYILKEGDEYILGLKFSNLGEYARNRKYDYIKARRMAEELDSQLSIDAAFIVEENGLGVYLRSEVGEITDPNLHPQIGERMYLHTIAAGKAILVELPQYRVEEIIDQWGLPTRTEHTITDREELQRELDEIQKRGFAINKGESDEGVRALAVPVHKPNGQILGGISVSGPKYRMSGEWFERELPQKIIDFVESYTSDW